MCSSSSNQRHKFLFKGCNVFFLTGVIFANALTTVLASTSSTSFRDGGQCEANRNECLLYMAPSSIPNAGFGMFTTRSIAKDELVIPIPDAPTITICDENLFYHFDDDFPQHESDDSWVYNDYVWNGEGFSKFECDDVDESVISFSMSNFHTVLHNTEKINPIGYDETLVHRSENHSAGSFSYNKGHKFYANKDIEAGGEIFLNYGEGYLDFREKNKDEEVNEEKFTDFVPRNKDFVQTVKFIEMMSLDDNLEDYLRTLGNNFKRESPSLASLIFTLLSKPHIESIIKKWNEHTSEATKVNELALATTNQRNVAWLKENGVCMSNLSPDISTIKGAGHGAFTRFFIEKGKVVTPAPLLNIAERDKLIMYNKQYKEDGQSAPDYGNPIGHQLLINYCFGNIRSKLLLCPQSTAAYINHCSLRSESHCGPDGPNAKLQWATSWDPDTKDWLKFTIDEITELTALGKRGLSLEVVATRDIQPGEEIFIDYGPNWEKAWNVHKEKWESLDHYQHTNYVPVMKMDRSDIRTQSEQVTNPYPDNIQTVCFIAFYRDVGDDKFVRKVDYEFIETSEMIDIEEELDLFPCDIIEHSNNRYTVSVDIAEYEDRVVLTNYPKGFITFRMKKYSSDHYLDGVFRHFLEIDDDIFPEQWKTEKKDWSNNIKTH